MAGLWSGKEFGDDGMTIAAVATAMGSAACGQRALIRISGPAITQGLGGIIEPIPQLPQASIAHLHLPSSQGSSSSWVSVPVLVMRGCAPKTFTGQDTLEILLPANAALVQRILAALCALPGVRHAYPGEFSARAYLAGKMSLDEAQHVAALIAATRDEELLAARQLRTGEPGQRAAGWAEEIAEILALVEAGIDFADQEDVVAISVDERRSRISGLITLIAHSTGTTGEVRGTRLDGLPRVVLWGPANAGKSTLFNALLGRERAVASPVAGTTRDALEEEWEPAIGDRVVLVDVAGVAEVDPRERLDAAAQQAARRALRGADVILWCDPTGHFDERGAPTLDDAAAAQVLKVRTMADIPRADVPPQADIEVCGLDGWNLDQLARRVQMALMRVAGGHGGMGGTHASAQLLLVPRHRAAVQGALRRLHEARDQSGSDELCATALRGALDALGEMTGEISADEVLGRVFARFCIGK
jgi:tRNA modification GTPase